MTEGTTWQSIKSCETALKIVESHWKAMSIPDEDRHQPP